MRVRVLLNFVVLQTADRAIDFQHGKRNLVTATDAMFPNSAVQFVHARAPCALERPFHHGPRARARLRSVAATACCHPKRWRSDSSESGVWPPPPRRQVATYPAQSSHSAQSSTAEATASDQTASSARPHAFRSDARQS